MTTRRQGRSLEPTESAVLYAAITTQVLEPLAAAARAQVATEEMGALVVFDGLVRNHDHGESVTALSYTAHPQAEDYMQKTVSSVAADIAGVRLWAVHRVGPIGIGESALTVIAAAAHRDRAFRACELVTDRIKAGVPIWKEQELSSGKVEWVGLDT